MLMLGQNFGPFLGIAINHLLGVYVRTKFWTIFSRYSYNSSIGRKLGINFGPFYSMKRFHGVIFMVLLCKHIYNSFVMRIKEKNELYKYSNNLSVVVCPRSPILAYI